MGAAIPEKTPYRVVTVGATYYDPIEGLAPDGTPTVLQVYKVGRRGDTIDLTGPQAARLVELGAVRPLDAPRSYDEMDDTELLALTVGRGVAVRGTGANGAVLREDIVNTLLAYDHGQGAGAAAAVGVEEALAAGSPLVDTPQLAPDASVSGVEGASDEQLRAFVQDNNAQDVVDAAAGNPTLAQRLLDAEQAARGADARKTVVSGLESVAARD